MKQILDYLLSPFFHLYFLVVLLIFHPIQVLAYKLGGDRLRKRTVIVLNWFFVKGFWILGCPVRFSGFEKLPVGRPLIIVANHQSLYDIPAVALGFRKFYPRFISKIELSLNIPTISYDLRKSGSALIDRENGAQSVKEIFRLGRLIEKERFAACIFPEGTRSEDGQVRDFLPAGILTLMRAAPSALVVPFVIDGHDRLQKKGMFPLAVGTKITYTALDVIDPKQHKPEEVVAMAEHAIKKALHQVS